MKEERYYSVIRPQRNYVITENSNLGYVYSGEQHEEFVYYHFNDEIYKMIKRCCVKYEPTREYTLFFGVFIKLFFIIFYYSRYRLQKLKKKGNEEPSPR